jgi:hypothetical protein
MKLYRSALCLALTISTSAVASGKSILDRAAENAVDVTRAYELLNLEKEKCENTGAAQFKIYNAISTFLMLSKFPDQRAEADKTQQALVTDLAQVFSSAHFGKLIQMGHSGVFNYTQTVDAVLEKVCKGFSQSKQTELKTQFQLTCEKVAAPYPGGLRLPL